MKISHFAAGLVLSSVLGAASAQAADLEWAFNYTTVAGDTVTGDIFTTTTAVSLPSFSQANLNAQGAGGQDYYTSNYTVTGYAITNIIGTRDGVAITGLYNLPNMTSGTQQEFSPSGSPGGTWVYDNLLYVNNAPATPYVDLAGLEFTTGTGSGQSFFNVYSTSAQGGYTENYTAINSMSVSAVPLPAAMPLFAAALVGMAGFGWYSRRRSQSNI
jgi:hypothetical protein